MPEPTAPTLPLTQRTEVDGVPVLWAEAPGHAVERSRSARGRDRGRREPLRDVVLEDDDEFVD